mmetsp:Transcript_5987/g.10001  ORF Transcript_5987/g.10001 Transcript_5987/m.10001 type:complete len:114 (+) Transcript_5987:347-688(+)
MLFVIRGSSGIGKSTFLACFVVRMRKVFANTAVFYASKTNKSLGVEDYVECVVWVDGNKVIEGTFRHALDQITTQMPKLDLIGMNGCTMPLDLTNFTGVVIVAASPSSMYVKI